MAEHPNAVLTREAYDAFSRGDLDAVGERFASDVVYHVLGSSPLTGDYKGQEEVFGFFGKLFELSGGTISLEVHDVLANDEHGVALVYVRGQRDGKSLDMPEAHVFHYKDGKVAEFWALEQDQAAADKFWS
jgi:ketosteroid isomerase-like protein